MPSQFQYLIRLRHQLKKYRAVVLLWHLLKKFAVSAQYYVTRLIGHTTYPILGGRVPLRGFHAETRHFLRRGNGRFVSLEPTSSNDCPPSDGFKSDIFVAIIPRARSLYDYGVIVSPDHRLLADVWWEGIGLFSEPRQHPAMYELRFPPIQHIAGRVAVITSLKPDNYYHWMFDILPRLSILQKSGSAPDYYVVNATNQFQRDSLQVLQYSFAANP